MANWLLAIDADEEQRKAYVASVAANIAPIAGLQLAQREGAGWSVVWAAAQNAPVSVDVSSAGGAVLWGEARDGAGALQSAADIRSAWRNGASAQWDGFYSALVVEDNARSVTVGTDLLGIFPVYYWTDGKGLVLIGTSAELFRSHPRFEPTLNVNGLVGILLTNGLVGGETLWRGVQRLGPGQRLRMDNGKLFEDEGFRIPVGLGAVDLPLEGHVQQLADAVAAAVKRHAPPGRSYGLLLSGGLDSRLLAGFLAEQAADVRTLTFGRHDDVEMRCARRIAKALHFPHQTAEVAADDYPRGAERLAKWDALASGFGGATEWAMHEHIRPLADRTITGHMMDGIIGGLHLHWAYHSKDRRMCFESLLQQVTGWGFAPDELRQMLLPQHASLVDSLLARLQEDYQRSAPLEHQRAWLFDLQHRMRFHVGSAAWALSFASWPVLPFLDREVLRVAAAMPCASLADRRAQTSLLVTRFPKLAGLPLDRNSYDSRPLLPTLRHELAHHLRERLRAAGLALRTAMGLQRREQLYYRRLFNLNAPGWRQVRSMAEAGRAQLAPPLQAKAIEKHWPAPQTDIANQGSIRSQSGTLLLLGFALWAKQLRNR